MNIPLQRASNDSEFQFLNSIPLATNKTFPIIVTDVALDFVGSFIWVSFCSQNRYENKIRHIWKLSVSSIAWIKPGVMIFSHMNALIQIVLLPFLSIQPSVFWATNKMAAKPRERIWIMLTLWKTNFGYLPMLLWKQNTSKSILNFEEKQVSYFGITQKNKLIDIESANMR